MNSDSKNYHYSSLRFSINNSEMNEIYNMENSQNTLKNKCAHLLVPMENINPLDSDL